MTGNALWLTTAGEYGPLAEPRKCLIAGEFKSEIDGGTVVVLKVDPPFSDLHLTRAALSEEFVIVSRALGQTYSRTVEVVSPVFLYDVPLLMRTARIIDPNSLVTRTYNLQQIQLLPREALFRDKDAAQMFYDSHARLIR